MDRMADSGSADMGSIPVGGTAKRVEALLLPVFFIPSFSLCLFCSFVSWRFTSLLRYSTSLSRSVIRSNDANRFDHPHAEVLKRRCPSSPVIGFRYAGVDPEPMAEITTAGFVGMVFVRNGLSSCTTLTKIAITCSWQTLCHGQYLFHRHSNSGFIGCGSVGGILLLGSALSTTDPEIIHFRIKCKFWGIRSVEIAYYSVFLYEINKNLGSIMPFLAFL